MRFLRPFKLYHEDWGVHFPNLKIGLCNNDTNAFAEHFVFHSPISTDYCLECHDYASVWMWYSKAKGRLPYRNGNVAFIFFQYILPSNYEK